jgi:hypothetical protein
MMRYARFAAAVLFALLAVGFVALWVRSYYVYDCVWGTTRSGTVFDIGSHWGGIIFQFDYSRSIGPELTAASFTDPETFPHEPEELGPGFGFAYFAKNNDSMIVIPHWFLAALSLGLAAIFAFKRTWRYSLRTVLIATTILAGLLGLAVWAV